ncbi:MAG: HDIG domain-containing protein [Smithellaceae bacterium]|nr:HDIG domain-containing protein [Smithellaceae bacterium]
MTRQEAFALLKERVSNGNLVKHSLATEAIMGAVAAHFGEDEEIWRLAGLLHDIDYDATRDDPARHSREGSQFLAELGLDPRIVYAVLAHNERHGAPRESKLDRALYAVDPLTGLITAAALIRPEKSLSVVTPQFVLGRFGEKGFARGANRPQIGSCTELGLTLEEFVTLGIAAMQEISQELGL